MKKLFLFSLVAITSFLLTNCQKESMTSNTPSPKTDSNLNIDEITQAFKTDYDNFKNGHIYKSDRRLSISDAIFEMDATFNSTYCDASHKCGKLQWDISYITLDLVNSTEADYDDVLIAYDKAINLASDIFYQVHESNQQLVMVTIEDDGADGVNKRKLKLTTVIGYNTFSDDFGVDEAYRFERGAQVDCNLNYAYGAPIILETMLNEYFNPEPSTSCRYYFYGATTTVYFEAGSSNRLSNPLDNYLDYKVFYADSYVLPFTDETFCLEYDQQNSGLHEMDEYYNYYREFAEEWMNSSQNTNNLRFSPSIIHSYDNTTGGRRIIKHSLSYKFRKRSVMCNTVSPLPL